MRHSSQYTRQKYKPRIAFVAADVHLESMRLDDVTCQTDHVPVSIAPAESQALDIGDLGPRAVVRTVRAVTLL